ncbi:MAG: DUF3488 and DUF4129 domain-containing transglutaminase family protein [Marinobacter sp.]|uniref:transglutaminase TgpA family protein n=1 Tax=Marinobacter sp. TaxID=50741 RepID=UPI00299DA1FE|nr:DUF3488 and DUF4129 domain-containing transglutaminase family protein [Marinobacter sp.]MDX1754938.1 DUF3488 and DUF4129 domain-containing transglutaminase family protein [Marinobacter sp.]
MKRLARSRHRRQEPGPQPPVPGPALLWLIAGFWVLLTPQWDRLPLWLLATCVVLAGWRWLSQVGRVRLPGLGVKSLIMVALIATYGITVNGHFTVDTAASFFVIAVALKWLETRSERDYYVLFFILVYLSTVNFLFEQGILWTLVNLGGVLLLLIGLQVLNAPDLPHALRQGWRRLGGMFLKSLPVVVLLFLFFPRLEPLWSVPLVTGTARTGISDTMAPGDISSLAQSSERAFRVSFGSELPPSDQRYWRGLILDRFDGDRWSQWQPTPQRAPGRVLADGGVGELGPDEYDVLMDPSGRRWAFSLENSRAVSDNVIAGDWGLFRFRRPADTPVRYRLAMADPKPDQQPLTELQKRRFLQLPTTGNPRARAFAGELRRQTRSSQELIDRLLMRFRDQPYFYTLRPPAMPVNGVDTLLFEAMRGFCAHYAGATTFVLRAAGIPARVVVGYQGGQAGAGGDYLIVRQYDAHAWVEAWLPDSGWIRLDPTAAIAPSRIQSGLRDAVAAEGSFLENSWTSPQRYGDVALIQWASLQLDKLNYQWQRWVVGYQGQTQMNLMSRLPGNISLTDLGYLTAGLVALVLLLIGGVTAWRQRRLLARDPVARLVARWRRDIGRAGIGLQDGQTPFQVADAVARHSPQAGAIARDFARTVNNHYYGGHDTDAHNGSRQTLMRLKRLLQSQKQALKLSG